MSTSSSSSSNYWWNIVRIGAEKVREQLGVDGSGVIVGIIDSGFSGNHPDLVPRWKTQHGWMDFLAGQPDPYDATNGHGTEVTGIIVAGDNSGDNIGVAPGTEFISAKVFDNNGYGTPNNALLAMQWMLDPDADGNPNTGDEHVPDVVNNSWGWPGSFTFFWNAINNWVAADIFPVFIAHNDGPNPSTVRVPGSYPQSFCVGAVDDNDVVQNFSGRGPVTWSGNTYIKPDVVAPSGPAIKFCVPTDQTFWQQNFPSGYHTFSGKTSTSGPHVTGAVALIKSAHPGWSVDQIKQALESSAVDLGAAGKDNDSGSGRIDVYSAIAVGVPEAPRNLAIPNRTQDGQHPILQWDANVEPDIDHYAIYRGYQDSKIDPINWLSSPSGTTTNTTWTDPFVTISNSATSRVHFRVTAVDSAANESGYSNSQYVNSWQVPKAHDEDTESTQVLPTRIRLHPNYPNPFNPATEIRLELPQPSEVTFTIFSINGKEVRTLYQGPLVAGHHTFSWDGKDGRGRQLASGTYFYRFEALTAEAGQSTFIKVGKMTLLR